MFNELWITVLHNVWLEGLFNKNLHTYNIYWSNVLTERFSISYKNQTKKDTRLEIWFKSRYP